MKNHLLSLFLLSQTILALAQTDTSFWFAAPDISFSHGDRPVVFRFASFDKAATIKLSLPTAGIVFDAINLAPNSVESYTVYTPDFLEVKQNGVQNNGIKIQSSSNITAYYEADGGTYRPQSNIDIFALKGRYALGTYFVIPMQNQFPNQSGIEAYSRVAVVATEDNTQIQFVPSAPLYPNGKTDTVKITLNRGQTYDFRALTESSKNKLAGSRILSSKPIAVTGSDDSVLSGGNWDLIGDQLIPLAYGGTKYVLPEGYIAVASRNKMSFSTLNGNHTLDSANHFSKTFYNPRPQLVDFPDTVVINYIDQYRSGSGGELGGAIIPSIACSGSREVSFVRSSDLTFYLYLVYRTSARDSFLLNNKPFIFDTTLVYKLDSNLSYVKLALETDQIPVLQASRIKNTLAPFHLAIGNGGESTGFELGYFSNFRNEIADTIYVCEQYSSFEQYRNTLDLYGNIALDTLDKSKKDSLFVKFKVRDEYCVFEDSAIMIQSAKPVFAIADSLTLCQGLDSTLAFDAYKVVFNDFIEQKNFKITGDSIKIYLENKAKCWAQKTIQINYLDSLSVVFPNDSSFCQGDSIQLNYSGNHTQSLVDNTSSTSPIIANNSTTFELKLSNQCGAKTKIIQAIENPLPTFDLGKNRTICGKNQLISLSPSYNYSWQDKSTTNKYELAVSGQLSAQSIDSNGCTFTDSVYIVLKAFDSIPTIEDRKICPGSDFDIELSAGHDQYLWNDGINIAKRTFGVGSYSVEIKTSNDTSFCYLQKINFEVSEWNQRTPNIITPNGDLKNETFQIVGKSIYYPQHLQVYNRWGETIFSSADYQDQFGKEKLSAGVYYYETKVPDFDCTYNKGFLLIEK